VPDSTWVKPQVHQVQAEYPTKYHRYYGNSLLYTLSSALGGAYEVTGTNIKKYYREAPRSEAEWVCQAPIFHTNRK